MKNPFLDEGISILFSLLRNILFTTNNRRNRQFGANLHFRSQAATDVTQSSPNLWLIAISVRRTRSRVSFFGSVVAFARRGWKIGAHEPHGSCVHACTDAGEYNSGNTMELGQFCFDARLRSFHLVAAPFLEPRIFIFRTFHRRDSFLSTDISRTDIATFIDPIVI